MNSTSELILSERLKCLSCATRREIILLIKKNALSVRDIAKSINMTQNTIKRHIKILVDCELLSIDKRGNTILYCANLKSLRETVNMLREQIREID